MLVSDVAVTVVIVAFVDPELLPLGHAHLTMEYITVTLCFHVQQRTFQDVARGSQATHRVLTMTSHCSFLTFLSVLPILADYRQARDVLD